MKLTETKDGLLISFDNTKQDMRLWKDIYGSHTLIGSKVYGDFPEVKKVTDYLYEITVDDYDENYMSIAIKANN